ncbi:SAM-dependent methyltransferase [Streptomyces sp. t39]|uniref:SAM-dependent methyltransferase n=1 Tax=Streptomyces sp. t39 TaxID=1828156 RepID=UPI0029058AA0|nr:SAM-dependent methyltransferase [Streptomyces sp. t39]
MSVLLGVDKDPQPRYPFNFCQSDAIAFVMENLDFLREHVDLVHASPPCQHDSDCQRIQGREHPDLIGPTRNALEALGLPYVIENVGGAAAKLRDPAELCGAMFGLHTYRHRYFEAGGGFSFAAPGHPPHLQSTVKMGRALKPGDFYHAVGNFSNVAYVREDMGVTWMNRDGIRECIPPAYTEYIGRQFIQQHTMIGAS